jgi:Arc/MetJ-type ribon-helix-helix transcriptional regulator
MVRTQIQLTEQQAESLKAAAARRGVSMAELIRQSIDDLLEKSGEPSVRELRLKAAAAAGRFNSGQGDVSVRHDNYLAEALKK